MAKSASLKIFFIPEVGLLKLQQPLPDILPSSFWPEESQCLTPQLFHPDCLLHVSIAMMSSHQSFWVSVYVCGAFLLIPLSIEKHPHGFNLPRAATELAYLQSATSLTPHAKVTCGVHLIPLRQKRETSYRSEDKVICSVKFHQTFLRPLIYPH